MILATDSSVIDDELPLPVKKPFGYYIYPCRPFVLVSQSTGNLGYFDSEANAEPFIRMLMRRRLQIHGPRDFRLFKHDPETCCWHCVARKIEV